MIHTVECATATLDSLQAQSAPEARELNLEDALDAADQLQAPRTFNNGSTKVISGLHPTLGAVHIIFPAIGECVLLA